MGNPLQSSKPSLFCGRQGKGSKLRPSEDVLRQVFGTFGEVRYVDIPMLDPYRKEIMGLLTKPGTIQTFNYGQDIQFEAYVQYQEYISFVKAMDALRGMKLMFKEDEDKAYTACIKVTEWVCVCVRMCVLVCDLCVSVSMCFCLCVCVSICLSVSREGGWARALARMCVCFFLPKNIIMFTLLIAWRQEGWGKVVAKPPSPPFPSPHPPRLGPICVQPDHHWYRVESVLQGAAERQGVEWAWTFPSALMPSWADTETDDVVK